MSDDLISRLKEIQQAHRWNDNQMAKHIGVDRSFWVRVKTGERKPGLMFLGNMLAKLPELKEEAVEYMVNVSQLDKSNPSS